MKICVFSDSHGYEGNMTAAIGLEDPAMIFFLGDGEREFEDICRLFPGLPAVAVRGNCDLRSSLGISETYEAGGIRIFATHGHMYNVKYEWELETLTAAALRAGADVALFGHTHRQHLSENDGLLIVNPGSIGRSIYPCYAVLNIEGGKCRADLKVL